MSLIDIVITIGVLVWFGILAMSKIKKKPMGECVKEIFEWFEEKPENPIIENLNPINNLRR